MNSPPTDSPNAAGLSLSDLDDAILANLDKWTETLKPVRNRGELEDACKELETLREEMTGLIKQVISQKSAERWSIDPKKAAAFPSRLDAARERLHVEVVRISPIFGSIPAIGNLIHLENVCVRHLPPPMVQMPKDGPAREFSMIRARYQQYVFTNQKAPTSWEDFLAFVDSAQGGGSAEDRDLFHKMRDEGYVVRWGAGPDELNRPRLICYQKDMPVSRGWGVKSDGMWTCANAAELRVLLLFETFVDVRPTREEAAAAKAQYQANPPAEDPAAPSKSRDEQTADAGKSSRRLPTAIGGPKSADKAQVPSESKPETSEIPDIPIDPRRPPVDIPGGRGTPLPMPDMPIPSVEDRLRNSRAGPDARPPTAPSSRLPGTSQIVGGSGGMPFRTVDARNRPVIGVSYAVMNWMGKPAIQVLDPLYESTTRRGPYKSVLAKDGYALGALQVDADDLVRAVRLGFYRIKGDGLDPSDSYVSDWIGTPSGGKPVVINGEGRRVLGFTGRKAAVVDALGIVCEQP